MTKRQKKKQITRMSEKYWGDVPDHLYDFGTRKQGVRHKTRLKQIRKEAKSFVKRFAGGKVIC